MTTNQAAPAAISIPQLRTDLKGQVIAPGDADYDRARTVVTGGIDRRPAVIVKVADIDDVVDVVRLARETGLELAAGDARDRLAEILPCRPLDFGDAVGRDALEHRPELDDVVASEAVSHDVENLQAERTILEDDLRQFFETYKV